MTAAASAHPGDWNGSSCHNGRRKVGCQRPGGGQPPASKGRRDFAGVSATTIAFRSCAEAPAAVASPIRRGPPGMDATRIATATATATASPPRRRTSALFISGRHQPTFAPLQPEGSRAPNKWLPSDPWTFRGRLHNPFRRISRVVWKCGGASRLSPHALFSADRANPHGALPPLTLRGLSRYANWTYGVGYEPQRVFRHPHAHNL